MFVSPQQMANIQPPLKALDWAPHPISLPDIALQLPMALASAWPDEGSVAERHDPPGAMVTTVQPSSSGTMASAGMTRHAKVTANAFIFTFRLHGQCNQSEDGRTGEG